MLETGMLAKRVINLLGPLKSNGVKTVIEFNLNFDFIYIFSNISVQS